MPSDTRQDTTVEENLVPPLTRPQLAEARRIRAVELLEQGHSQAEVARMVGVSAESVRRWKRRLEEGGVTALQRRVAPGRPTKLTDAQVEQVRHALERGARAHGFDSDAWTLRRVAQVVENVTGVELSLASVWRLLTARLGYRLQRQEDEEIVVTRWVITE